MAIDCSKNRKELRDHRIQVAMLFWVTASFRGVNTRMGVFIPSSASIRSGGSFMHITLRQLVILVFLH